MLREFFHYFALVVQGKRDPLTGFVEPLTMAERYLRWGRENGDIRDYRCAVDQLSLCVDRDAPLASLVLRKYACLAEAVTAAVDLLERRHRKVLDQAAKNESDLHAEKEALARAILVGKQKIRKLQDEGSLIKVKDEEKHVAEFQSKINHIDESLASDEAHSDICDSYDRMVAEAQKFLRELDQGAAMVTMCSRLEADAIQSLTDQLRTRLDSLRERLDKLNPTVREDGAPPGSMRPPPVGAGA